MVTRRGRGAERRPLHLLRPGLRPGRGVPARVRAGRRRPGRRGTRSWPVPVRDEADYQAAVRPARADRLTASGRHRPTRRRSPGPRSASSPAPRPGAVTARSWPARSASSRPSAPDWPGRRSQPDLLLSDGEAHAGREPGRSARARRGRGLDALPARLRPGLAGRRHVMMVPSQIDRFGNTNISAIGDSSARRPSCSACAARPGNTVNHPTSYWVPKHSRGRSCRRSTWSAGSATTARPRPGRGASRFHDLRRVVTNLAVLDFAPRIARCGWLGAPGRHASMRCRAATGFDLVVPDDVPPTRAAHRRGARLIREVIDPRDCATARCRHERRRPLQPGRCTPAHLRAVRGAISDRADRHGLCLRAPADRGDGQRGRPGHPRQRHADATTSWRPRSSETRKLTDQPFGVNLRADAPDVAGAVELLISTACGSPRSRWRRRPGADRQAQGRRARS